MGLHPPGPPPGPPPAALCWWWCALTLAVCLPSAATAAASLRNAVETRGDVTLGGLFPVHEKGDVAACGRKVYNRGVQRLEAMLYAVDTINRDPELLPGIELGVNILDTCSRDTYALNQSLTFVRSTPNSIDLTALECRDQEPPRLKRGIPGRIIGVVGGSYSSVSIQVATLLRLFRVPQVSPASTAKDLSDKSRFEFFARTVPPDNFQAIAMVDVVKSLNWTYVSTVHSEGTYGENGIDVFQREANERGVCIAAQIKVHGNADQAAFDDVIRKLSKGNARAVVLFTRAEDARALLLAASRSKEPTSFLWLASDGWGRQPHVVRDVEEVAEGALTVELHTEPIPGFDAYMAGLTPQNNARNPWFDEYWQETFNCTLGAGKQAAAAADHCAPGLKLGPDVGYLQESKVPFVVDAVYAFAHALHALQRDVCGGNGTCPAMLSMDGGSFYYNYLLKVNFTDLAGTQVKFNRMGDGLARYDISNYQRAENSSGYVYKTVGWWSETLVLDVEALAWTNGTRSVPTSTCSEPCGVGMIKRHHKKGDVCCWICDTCEEYEYVYNESTCVDCGKGSWPYPDKRSCYELDVQYIPFFSPVAYGPLIVAASGVAFTLATVGVFVQYNDTPLVRATGRELSYALLMGITLCFANTFILLQKPSLLTCTVQRFSVGMGFCIIYSALLTKTNRISRIFDSASKSARRPKFISPKSQVLITVGLILVQTLGTFAWLVAEPPGTRFDYPDRRQVWLKCRINDESFLLSQLYNILLICVCTVYAFKTRKIPENFNESKFIVFTMYTTCVIWLAFLPIYFTTRHAQEVQALTLCVSISLSAWVSLGCLFAPKVYIILFHPEKNVRRLTMSTTYRRRSGGGRASSSGVPTATTALAEHHDHNNRGSGHYQACTPVGQAVDLVVSQSPGPTASTSTNVVEGHEAAALL